MIVQKASQVNIRMGRWSVVTAKWRLVVIESGDVVGGVNTGGLCVAANPSDIVPGWIWPGINSGTECAAEMQSDAAAVLLHQCSRL